MLRAPAELIFDPWYPPRGALLTARHYHGLSPLEVVKLLDVPAVRLSMLEAGIAKVHEEEGHRFIGLYGLLSDEAATGE